MTFLMVLLNPFNDLSNLWRNFQMKSKTKINCIDFLVISIMSQIFPLNLEKFTTHYFKGSRKTLLRAYLNSQVHKSKVKYLRCLGILYLDEFMIVKIDVSGKGFKGILKQRHAQMEPALDIKSIIPVSYTHLTLPTKRIV